MPELPEVETVARGLRRLVLGKTIRGVHSDTPKSFPNNPYDVQQFIIGARVLDVRRRAKMLRIELSSNYTLLVHLKMTGQLVFVDTHTRFGAGHPNDSLVGKLPDASTRVSIEFSDMSMLYFNDQRKFGWMRLLPTAAVEELDSFMKLGPEPLEVGFTVDDFRVQFVRRAHTNIKAALLDQTVVAGVGNIYADESLWGAKIHPKRLVGSLTDQEWGALYHDLRSVMQLAIERGGSTDANYVNAEGKKGSYMDFARAFRREGLPCPRCGAVIEKLRVAGRGTHICPSCQVY